MTFDLLSLLGVEGIAIFSLIVLVGFGLSGFRFSAAGMNGEVAGNVPAVGQLRNRQRLTKRVASPVRHPAKRSRSREVMTIAEWFFAATRSESAKSPANQSRFDRHQARLSGAHFAGPVQPSTNQLASDDHRACVSRGEPGRMDSETQWSRVNTIVNEGLAQAKEIEELHAAAARQLDAVDYAYERMLLELRDVLPGVIESRTVCRTNREEAYAAVDAASAKDACPGNVPGVQQEAVDASTTSSLAPPAAARNKSRKPKAAASVAA